MLNRSQTSSSYTTWSAARRGRRGSRPRCARCCTTCYRYYGATVLCCLPAPVSVEWVRGRLRELPGRAWPASWR